jgi:hypothetical protein
VLSEVQQVAFGKTVGIKEGHLAHSQVGDIKQRNYEENNSQVTSNGKSLLYLNLNGNIGVQNGHSDEIEPAFVYSLHRAPVDGRGEEEPEITEEIKEKEELEGEGEDEN